MDQLTALDALGLTLPSPVYIVGTIVFGIIGFVAYRYGAKMALATPKWIGVALMLYPYVISQTWLLYAVGIGLCLALYVCR